MNRLTTNGRMYYLMKAAMLMPWLSTKRHYLLMVHALWCIIIVVYACDSWEIPTLLSAAFVKLWN